MTSVAQRVQKRRDALRAAGFRPVQIWVPDTKQAGFREECRRQSRLIQDDLHEQEVLGWISSVADSKGWV